MQRLGKTEEAEGCNKKGTNFIFFRLYKGLFTQVFFFFYKQKYNSFSSIWTDGKNKKNNIIKNRRWSSKMVKPETERQMKTERQKSRTQQENVECLQKKEIAKKKVILPHH